MPASALRAQSVPDYTARRCADRVVVLAVDESFQSQAFRANQSVETTRCYDFEVLARIPLPCLTLPAQTIARLACPPVQDRRLIRGAQHLPIGFDRLLRLLD